jgi:Flp pilus assembly protein TadG
MPARADERGSASVELAILAPVAVLLLGLLVVGFRIANASTRITGVAGSAAREASIARTATAAKSMATQGARSALDGDNFHCSTIQVHVDTSGFAAPPGQPASVRVDVYCTVALADISVPGLPGHKTLHDSAFSPLDPARDQP